MTALGATLKAMRKACKLSQAQLATLTGVGQTYISDIEAGKTKLPSRDHRQRLAKPLGTSNVEFLIAAGEVDTAELITWAQTHGFTAVNPSSFTQVVADLEADPGPRHMLALVLPLLTNREADWFFHVVSILPTEAARQRKELVQHKLTPETYRRWRDMYDQMEAE